MSGKPAVWHLRASIVHGKTRCGRYAHTVRYLYTDHPGHVPEAGPCRRCLASLARETGINARIASGPDGRDL